MISEEKLVCHLGSIAKAYKQTIHQNLAAVHDQSEEKLNITKSEFNY